MNEMNRLKRILDDLGYLNVYLNKYLVNTQKQDNLENLQQYINQNLDVWLRDGHRMWIINNHHHLIFSNLTSHYHEYNH